jgi:RNA polymerase sigma-70 factor, ECF subfamily
MGNKQKKFSKIYDQYIEKIYRFVFLKVNSQETAQDICSETFLKGWQVYKKNNKIKNFSAFLYRIARNLVIDHYREKGRKKFIPLESVAILDNNPGLEEKAIISSDLEEIRLNLVNLKDDYQNVIIWHYLDDLPIQKVAEIMEKSEGATRVVLHRALTALKQEINKKDIKQA